MLYILWGIMGYHWHCLITSIHAYMIHTFVLNQTLKLHLVTAINNDADVLTFCNKWLCLIKFTLCHLLSCYLGVSTAEGTAPRENQRKQTN